MGENEQELDSNTLLIKNRDFLSVKLYVFRVCVVPSARHSESLHFVIFEKE